METNKPTESQTAGQIKLIQKLFCADEIKPILTPEQNTFLTERAHLEQILWDILECNHPEELKLIEEYGLMGLAVEVRMDQSVLNNILIFRNNE